jgi:hypothetical protein
LPISAEFLWELWRLGAAAMGRNSKRTWENRKKKKNEMASEG